MTGQGFDPVSVGDALDQLVETLSGLRAKLIAAGFNETAAEQICIQEAETSMPSLFDLISIEGEPA